VFEHASDRDELHNLAYAPGWLDGPASKQIKKIVDSTLGDLGLQTIRIVLPDALEHITLEHGRLWANTNPQAPSDTNRLLPARSVSKKDTWTSRTQHASSETIGNTRTTHTVDITDIHAQHAHDCVEHTVDVPQPTTSTSKVAVARSHASDACEDECEPSSKTDETLEANPSRTSKAARNDSRRSKKRKTVLFSSSTVDVGRSAHHMERLRMTSR